MTPDMYLNANGMAVVLRNPVGKEKVDASEDSEVNLLKYAQITFQ